MNYMATCLGRGAIVLFFFVATFLFAGGAYAAPNIKLAMITAKTGDAGVSNSISFPAARFAVAEINDNGGILGRHVELVEYDNYSTAEGSAEAARLAIEDGVHAVVGCNWSSHSIAMAKVLQEAGIPMISHMSTNEAVTRVGDYIFRACFTDSFQGHGMARFARAKLKCRTAALLVDKDRAYSVGLAKTFADSFEKLGGKIVWRGEYSMDSVDYDGLLKDMAKHDPDAIFIPGGYKDVSGFVGRAKDMGMTCDLLSADGIGIKMYDYIGDKAHGVYYSSHWSRWVDTKRSKEFVLMYEKEAGPVQEDTLPMVYDSFMLLKNAIERAGSDDGAKIRDALAATEGFEGVTGVIRFDENGDPIKPMVINEFKFGGVMYLDQIYP